MTQNSLISVIMPAYNAEDYIQHAINSVIAQTYHNWELIIIDDGSKDSTAEIIAQNIKQDVRIKSFYQQNGKQGKARNLGIAHSKGFYIAFLDSDDLWMPEKLSVQLEEITTKSVDLVFSDSYIFNDNEIIDRTKRVNTPSGFFSGKVALIILLEINWIPNLTVLAKKDKLLFVNGLSESLKIANAEDYHLWLKMLIKGCVFYGSDKTLAAYRVHGKSSTSDDRSVGQQTPEVFFDLAKRYPEAKKLITKAIVKRFKYSYSRGLNTRSDLNNAIEVYFSNLQKQSYVPFLKVVNYFFGTRVTKKFLNLLLKLLNI